jgi:hypothetical protein
LRLRDISLGAGSGASMSHPYSCNIKQAGESVQLSEKPHANLAILAVVQQHGVARSTMAKLSGGNMAAGRFHPAGQHRRP